MVVVDVENGHLLAAIVAQPLGGDGGVVEEAVAAVEVAAGMVAGRAAEREGRTLAAPDQLGCRERHVGRRRYRPPGAGGDWRARIDGVVAELAVDRLRQRRILAEAAGVPGERQRVIGAVRLHPFVPGRLQELDEALVVDAQHRIKPEGLRQRDRPETRGLDAVDDDLRPPRHLERRHELAVDELELAVLVAMLVGVDGLHASSRSPSSAVTALSRRCKER
jgi:hypothetical protein